MATAGALLEVDRFGGKRLLKVGESILNLLWTCVGSQGESNGRHTGRNRASALAAVPKTAWWIRWPWKMTASPADATTFTYRRLPIGRVVGTPKLIGER